MLFKNHDASCNSEFISTQISSWFYQVPWQKLDLHVCNPLGVAFNSSGKSRLILDLCYVNHHLKSCKYEDIRTAANLFQKGNYFFFNMTTLVGTITWKYSEAIHSWVVHSIMWPFSWRSRTTTSSMKGHGCLSPVGASPLYNWWPFLVILNLCFQLLRKIELMHDLVLCLFWW